MVGICHQAWLENSCGEQLTGQVALAGTAMLLFKAVYGGWCIRRSHMRHQDSENAKDYTKCIRITERV
jgi:hypothetical protein